MLRCVLEKTPFMGFTSTTIELVRNGIVHSFNKNYPYISTGSFHCKNPFCGVKRCHSSHSYLDELAKEGSKYNVNCGSIMTYCTTVKDTEQENQQREIMASLRTTNQYCLQSMERYGGKSDNYTWDKRERDMSKESFLLLFCINSCGGHWGLNMPIDILRGSRSRKVICNNFDKLPVHGLGKDHTHAWWKALACLLIAHGYLNEVVVDLYRRISVSSMGLHFLHSVNFSEQSPLILKLTTTMIDEENGGAIQSNIDDNKVSTDLEGKILSEVERKLYDILWHTRMKLAKDNGTVPYAICGDQTLTKIAMIRPSTLDRLANIEGVNQYLVRSYGDNFLQTINDASKELDLSINAEAMSMNAEAMSMNAEANTRTTSRKVFVRSERTANLEAWKIWQVDKKSFNEVAAEGRSVPIKESTVISYILEAARTGCQVDWVRFCTEIGLTREIFSQISSAISKSGSRRLKAIKEELPENVSFHHIMAQCTMDALNISVDEIFGFNSSSLLGNTTETECESFVSGRAETISTEAAMDARNQKGCDSPVHETSTKKLHTLIEDIENINDGLEAPEDSNIELIKNQEGGVAKSRIPRLSGIFF